MDRAVHRLFASPPGPSGKYCFHGVRIRLGVRRRSTRWVCCVHGGKVRPAERFNGAKTNTRPQAAGYTEKVWPPL